MPLLRVIGWTVAGFIGGFVIGVILWIPSCVVASATTGSTSRGEAVANNLNVLPWVGAAIGLIVALVAENTLIQEQANAERKRRDDEAAAKDAERQRHATERMRCWSEVADCNEQSLRAFEKLPVFISTAEEQLDKAEHDFARGAFQPFWKSVEHAAFALGSFEEGVRTIEQNSSGYVELARKAATYEITAPPFAVSSTSTPRLKLASETSQRMSAIVDKAQCNFEFSRIYLAIKQNEILVAGFTNLAQALEEMTWRVTRSIDGLTTSIDTMTTALDGSLRRLSEQGDRIASATEGLHSEAIASSAREQKALEMFDNIQRRRYPSLLHGGVR